MSIEPTAAQLEPRFNKRRKLVRRRVDDNDKTVGDAPAEIVEEPESSEHDMQVKPSKLSKKQGILFTATTRLPKADADMQVVHMPAESVQQPRINRFVSQTGQSVVEDDKHMLAFIDAKLASLQPSQASVIDGGSSISASAQAPDIGRDPDLGGIEQGTDTLASGASGLMPTNLKSNARPKRAYRRRKEPSQADLERDRVVDQVLSEVALPLYDFSHKKQMPQHDSNADNDVAAATAFKKGFLADLEEQNYTRRQPSLPQNAQGGPKLGGSRADREKMRMLEEQAKGKSSTVQR